MSKVAKFKTSKVVLEWVTIDGEGKENLSGKLQYVANGVVEADDAVIAAIEKFWADNKPAGFNKPAKSTGIYPHKSDTGEKDESGKAIYYEDGKMYLAFKTGTTFPDGSTKKVKTYNAKGREVVLPEGVKIGNGSEGYIAGAMGIYVSKTPKGAIVDAGVTLYLDAIQITKLVEFTSDAGFEAVDDEEGGWTGDDGEFDGYEEIQEPSAPKSKPRL